MLGVRHRFVRWLALPLIKIRLAYWWMFRPTSRGVRAILVRPDRRILLVSHTYRSGWFLPGGAVKPGESNGAAIRREVREETGLTLHGKLRTLGSYMNKAEYKVDKVTVYVSACQGTPTRHSREIAGQRFVPPRRLPRGTSPGTRRRIAEWRRARLISASW